MYSSTNGSFYDAPYISFRSATTKSRPSALELQLGGVLGNRIDKSIGVIGPVTVALVNIVSSSNIVELFSSELRVRELIEKVRVRSLLSYIGGGPSHDESSSAISFDVSVAIGLEMLLFKRWRRREARKRLKMPVVAPLPDPCRR